MVNAGPIRTCIGCRRRGPAAEMVRLRLAGGEIVTGRGAGRGASIHPAAACVAGAQKSAAFARAFKRPAAEIAALRPEDLLARLQAASADENLSKRRTRQR